VNDWNSDDGPIGIQPCWGRGGITRGREGFVGLKACICEKKEKGGPETSLSEVFGQPLLSERDKASYRWRGTNEKGKGVSISPLLGKTKAGENTKNYTKRRSKVSCEEKDKESDLERAAEGATVSRKVIRRKKRTN